MSKKVKPPYKPFENEKDWIKNFDPLYTKESPSDSICWIDPKILEQFKKDFEEFDENKNPLQDEPSEEEVLKTPESPLRSLSYRKSLKNIDKINEELKRLKSTPKKFENKVSFSDLVGKANDKVPHKKVLKFQFPSPSKNQTN